MDCEADAIITRGHYEFQNGLEPSIDVAGVTQAARQAYWAGVSDLVDEKEPSKEEKINNVKETDVEKVNY